MFLSSLIVLTMEGIRERAREEREKGEEKGEGKRKGWRRRGEEGVKGRSGVKL